MNIEAIPTGPFQEICYIIWDSAQQAIIIDPGDDADLILEALERHALNVAAYVCTHGHADHVSALAKVHTRHPAPVAMHSTDWAWAFESINKIEPHYSTPARPSGNNILSLESSKDWKFSDLHFQCIETPGHTPGSCCLFFPEAEVLISGDTLFKGSCGRTDLPGGNSQDLKKSLNKLKQLPDQLRVFPGHGEDTTIGIERATNFFMQ